MWQWRHVRRRQAKEGSERWDAMSSSNSVGREGRDIWKCLLADFVSVGRGLVTTWVGRSGDAELMVVRHRRDRATACHTVRLQRRGDACRKEIWCLMLAVIHRVPEFLPV